MNLAFWNDSTTVHVPSLFCGLIVNWRLYTSSAHALPHVPESALMDAYGPSTNDPPTPGLAWCTDPLRALMPIADAPKTASAATTMNRRLIDCLLQSEW